MGNPRKLPIQYGCILALALTAAFVVAITVGFASNRARPIDFGDISLFEFGAIGLPFAVMAGARTRDWLAWLIAIALTSAGWGWLIYEASLHPGVNLSGSFLLYLVAPLVVSGAALTTAGLRGKIPDWGQDIDHSSA